ncbi:RHS repeat-associated core domain-containing protein [Flavobacterium sp. 316]|uniref:RHS repeat domain-containing protein n=1 Tax=Flavobacterium sp. 316 TaxID=1603293 RepID=UPI0009E637CA
MGCYKLQNYTTLSIAHTSYTEPSREGKSCAGLYQYKYNGKELQTELGLNMYDYGWRNYDAALGRWMNMDNLAEKFITFSPYHYAGNNPISNIDVDGNEFTEAMQEWINKLISEINSMQKSNNEKIENARKTIASGKYGWFQSEKSLTKKIEKLTEQNNELNIVSDEISELECSTQVYDLVYDSNGTQRDYATGSSTTSNTTGFNFTNGNVEITISSGTSIGLFAHELKHAFQFEKGEFSIGKRIPNVPYSNLFYDKQDEIDAYNRGALFGQSFNGTLDSAYDRLPNGPYDFRNTSLINSKINNPSELQKIARGYIQAFRVNGQTYYYGKR